MNTEACRFPERVSNIALFPHNCLVSMSILAALIVLYCILSIKILYILKVPLMVGLLSNQSEKV